MVSNLSISKEQINLKLMEGALGFNIFKSSGLNIDRRFYDLLNIQKTWTWNQYGSIRKIVFNKLFFYQNFLWTANFMLTE